MALAQGMYGTDSGHEFKITQVDNVDVQIEYVEDGRSARFMKSRFGFDGGVLKLH